MLRPAKKDEGVDGMEALSIRTVMGSVNLMSWLIHGSLSLVEVFIVSEISTQLGHQRQVIPPLLLYFYLRYGRSKCVEK